MSDKAWESKEISLWVNNDEFLWRMARSSRNPWDFYQRLLDSGLTEIAKIPLTYQNLLEAWDDANED